MNKVLVLLASACLARCSPVEQTVIFNEDGSYKFNFDTGKEAGSIARHEERQADGTVVGRYSYEDPTGSLRVVNYRAGRQGFVATGDVGVAGAPPAQVPIQLPPEAPAQPEPDQDLQLTPEPQPPRVPDEPEKHDHPTEGPVVPPEKPETVVPDEETVKVAIPDESGRKREAGSPPVSYTDNFYPFAAPVFGKRRLDVPDEEDKSTTEDDADKKQDVKPPTSYLSPYDVPQKNPAPSSAPETKPADYFYYFPVAPNYGYFPGSHPSQQPANQFGPPKAWAYVPISAFPQQNAAFPQQNAAFPQQNAAFPQQNAVFPQHNAAFPQQNAAFPQQNAVFPQHNAAFPQHHAAFPQQNAAVPQPGGPPTSWVVVHPHAVNYVPGGANEVQTPGQSGGVPGSEDDSGSKVSTSPVQQSQPTSKPVEPVAEPAPEQKPVEQFKAGFQRPTVHHYHFRGPSHTYGYYYQY